MFWLDGRVLKIVWTLAFCYLLYLLRGTILLVVLAVIVAYLLLPTVDFIYARFTHHHHRGWALALVYLLIFAVIITVGGLIGYYGFAQAMQLAREIPDITQPDAIDHVHLPKILSRWDAPIRSHLKSWIELHGKDMLETLTSLSMQLLSAASSIVLLLIVLVLSYLLLRSGPTLIEDLIAAMPPRYQPKAREVLSDEHRIPETLGALGCAGRHRYRRRLWHRFQLAACAVQHPACFNDVSFRVCPARRTAGGVSGSFGDRRRQRLSRIRLAHFVFRAGSHLR